MPTLSEYAKLSTSVVQAGIMENISTWNEPMPLLQFKEISGNALLYNRENALPTAATHAVGDNGQARGPRFEHDVTETFFYRGQGKDIKAS